jgi:hypothetical protein
VREMAECQDFSACKGKSSFSANLNTESGVAALYSSLLTVSRALCSEFCAVS